MYFIQEIRECPALSTFCEIILFSFISKDMYIFKQNLSFLRFCNKHALINPQTYVNHIQLKSNFKC